MLDAYRVAEMTTSLLHIVGGLHGAWTHIMMGDLGGSLRIALTVAACVLILSGAVALAEVTRVMVRRFVRKYEHPSLPEPRNKGDLDA